MSELIFVTQSYEKVAEAARILKVELKHRRLELPEIQSVEVEEVVRYKAEYAYEALNRAPVMIEDTGLYFEAWNGLPGALIKWFIERVGVDGLCRMMEPFTDRRARAKTVVATYDGRLQTFAGEVAGYISDRPRGEGGFGWDKIFIPQNSEKTFSEMSADEKDSFSMRRLALEAMARSQGF